MPRLESESRNQLRLKDFLYCSALSMIFLSSACAPVQKSSDLRVIGGDAVKNSDGPLVYIRGEMK